VRDQLHDREECRVMHGTDAGVTLAGGLHQSGREHRTEETDNRIRRSRQQLHADNQQQDDSTNTASVQRTTSSISTTEQATLLWHYPPIHHLWHWMAYNVLMCRQETTHSRWHWNVHWRLPSSERLVNRSLISFSVNTLLAVVDGQRSVAVSALLAASLANVHRRRTDLTTKRSGGAAEL